MISNGAKKNLILKIYRSKNTVFSIKDIALLWGEANKELVKMRIYRYVKANKLYSLRKGFYAKDETYDKYELATKIYTPAYISFETVLVQAGVIFQHYEQVFLASYLSREIDVDHQKYSYKKIKDIILTNSIGIENKENYSIACLERAWLDMIYLNKNYYFDNLSGINWDRVFEILPIYKNKRMEREVKKYYNNFKFNK